VFGALQLHFNGQNPEPIEWPEFIDGLKKFRADPRPGVCDPSFCDYKSAGTLKDDMRVHKRTDAGPKQTYARPVLASQEYGFLQEEASAMNGDLSKFRKRWTDIALYGDTVERDSQGRTVASEMPPSVKKKLHEAQGSTIMLL